MWELCEHTKLRDAAGKTITHESRTATYGYVNLLTEVLWKTGSILDVEQASQLVEIQKNQLCG
jgi:hypothetical protein